jgi:hypothetical protein
MGNLSEFKMNGEYKLFLFKVNGEYKLLVQCQLNIISTQSNVFVLQGYRLNAFAYYGSIFLLYSL